MTRSRHPSCAACPDGAKPQHALRRAAAGRKSGFVFPIPATYYVGFAIILEASLSFLGIGVPPDVLSWGGMLTAAAQGHVTRAPWAGIFPGLAIFLAVLGCNLLGDALWDVLETWLRGARVTARLLSR